MIVLQGPASSTARLQGNAAKSKRGVVPQGHLFRCAPLRDAAPYTNNRKTLYHVTIPRKSFDKEIEI